MKRKPIFMGLLEVYRETRVGIIPQFDKVVCVSFVVVDIGITMFVIML